MRGRPPKPLEAIRRSGNPGKRALPTVGALALVPQISAEDHALSTGEVLDAVLPEVPWLTVTDRPVLALLRDAVEDYERARGGRAPFREVAHLRWQVVELLARVGLDPVSRRRLGVGEVRPVG